MKRTSTAVIVVGLLSWAQNATAQEARTYIGGGFMMVAWGGAHSLSGPPSLTFTNTSPEAVNTGVHAEAGRFLNRTVAFGVEVSFPFQRNPVTQEFGYFNPYRLVGRYREITVFAVFRAQTPPARVRLAAVGGGGVIWGDLLQRTAVGSFSRPGVFSEFGDEKRRELLGLAATFGSEVAATVAPRIQIAPQFRVSLIGRGTPDKTGRHSEMGSFGFNKVVYRSAVTVRAIF